MNRVVVGVDAGYKNFAVCAIRADSLKYPIRWTNESLFEGKFSEEILKQSIYQWIKKPEIEALLRNADLIVLERQMVKKFSAVNDCIRFLYFDKTIEVNPKTIAAQFGLSHDRKSKKKEVVKLVGANTDLLPKKGKKDDYADAFVLAMHGHFLKNPSLKAGWNGVEFSLPERQPATKKRAVIREIPDIGPGGELRGYFF